jgi:glycosyltransferase involved in cell wall biosynthesis
MREAKIARYEIIIAEDGSKDGTLEEAKAISRKDKKVRVLHSARRLGKGGAIMHAFSNSKGDVFAFLDADGATNPGQLGQLIFRARTAGIAVGSRYLRESSSKRKNRRFFVSKIYNFLLRFLFGSKVTDHSCGFKAFRADVARRLCKSVRDKKWFWDPEALILAQRWGYGVEEVRVEWKEKPDTQFRLVSDSFYIAGSIARLWLDLAFSKEK